MRCTEFLFSEALIIDFKMLIVMDILKSTSRQDHSNPVINYLMTN